MPLDYNVEPSSENAPEPKRDRFALEVLQHALDEALGQVTNLGPDEDREQIIDRAKLFLMRLGPHEHDKPNECQICYYDMICALAGVDAQWSAEQFRRRFGYGGK